MDNVPFGDEEEAKMWCVTEAESLSLGDAGKVHYVQVQAFCMINKCPLENVLNEGRDKFPFASSFSVSHLFPDLNPVFTPPFVTGGILPIGTLLTEGF